MGLFNDELLKFIKGRRRRLGRNLWRLLGHLPLSVRGIVIRSFFKVEHSLPQELIFKRAESLEEIEQALHIAYDGFHERGYVNDSASQLRITKFHALPTTAILIAKWRNEVIATLSIIVDTAMGLPIDELWNIDFLRRQSVRVAELSTLAIKRPYRSMRGRVLLPLCKFMYQYSREILGVDALVVAVNPEVRDFYRCVLLFEDLAGGEVKPYGFVRGANAAGLYLMINGHAEETYKRVYQSRPDSGNLYKFFRETNLPNFQFPHHPSTTASAFLHSPSQLEELFGRKSSVLSHLSESERQVIANSYFFAEYRRVVGARNCNRRFPRFAVLLPSVIQSRRIDKLLDARILEISVQGARARVLAETSLENEVVTLKVDIGRGIQVELSGKVQSVNEPFHEILIAFDGVIPSEWRQLLQGLESPLVSLVEHNPKTSAA